MKVLILNRAEVLELLPMPECIAVMEETLAALARGQATNPLRQVFPVPDRPGLMALMPAYLAEKCTLGAKIVGVFPENRVVGQDVHQGAVLIFEAEHGRLAAVIEAGAVTALRTAAVSGVATRWLAREDATTLAILGSGVQAHSHLRAMLAVRPITQVRIWSRQLDHAHALAQKVSEEYRLPARVFLHVRDAVAGADIICTTTSSPEPILRGEWLSPGVHINAVGSSLPFQRELDSAAVARSRLFVDRRESALKEAGDFVIPCNEGVVTETHIRGEIGEVLVGKIVGRQTRDEITLFKSVGLAVEDVASGYYLYEKALAQGRGTWVEFNDSPWSLLQ